MSTSRKTPAKTQRKTSLKRHPVSGKLSGGKPSKPSPSELAKADAKEFTSTCGSVRFEHKHPECAEYIDAVCALIREGKSKMSVRQMHDRCVEHFGYDGSDTPIHRYVQRKHGGMGALHAKA